MKRRTWRKAAGLAVALFAMGFYFPLGAAAQDQADVQKVYAAVAGTYEFVYEGQSLVIVFHVQDGKLFGREESGGEDAEIKPLDLAALKFETTVQSTGQYYEIGFSKDEEGKVTKCRLATGGIEIDGTRLK